jgi:hypothetical protein
VRSRIVGAGLGFVLAAACALCGLHPASAARLEVPPPIFVGGQPIRQPALLRHGHLLVPVRGMFEALHADVEYTAPRIVVVRRNGTVVAGLVIDRRHAVVYNHPRNLSAAPVRHGGRVYVPLRAVAEIAGASVTYLTNPRLVDIRVPNDELVVAPPRPELPVSATEDGPPLWVLGSIGAIVLVFAAECVRRCLIILRAGRTRRAVLRSGGLGAARQIAYTTGLRDQHYIGEIGKQTGVDDAVNRA